jgi:SAM-dependent methyltransferase
MISRAERGAGASHLRFLVVDAVDFCATCSQRFDLVLLIGVLEHLSDPTAALAAVARVLRAGGRLIVISPHPWNPVCCVKRLWDGGRDAPPADHCSPLQLRRIAIRQGLALSAIRALPYTPWPELGARGSPPAHIGRERRDVFAGMLHGAFAAEFRLGGRI